MNHALWARTGARVIAAAFIVAGVTACDRNKAADVRESAAPSPSTTVIGTPPGPPVGDTPETTPVTSQKSELSKTDESKNMPLEGQDSSHMTESRNDSQRAGKDDAQAQRRPQ